MRSLTAVEIGADTCALASTSVRGQELRVAAAETLDPAAFPGIEAFTLALRQARRTLKLPRRCRAVVWGLPDGASRRDAGVAPLIEPLTRAGFSVARVVTPCNALGALARLRVSRTGGAMCWLGVNRNGVAIVVIRPGKLLYSHSFAWDSSVGASGSQARLLQRYSLVAFLAPEVRRAIAAAKQKGTTVDGIVTCGNLPDLRALTMPLIEELDIEVETLDSLEGLVMKPELADKLSEVAPAIRLACAGAFARETRSLDESKRRRPHRLSWFAGVLGIVLALLAGGAYVWYQYNRPPPQMPRGAPAGKPASVVKPPPPMPPTGTPSSPAAPPPAVVKAPASVPVTATPPVVKTPAPVPVTAVAPAVTPSAPSATAPVPPPHVAPAPTPPSKSPASPPPAATRPPAPTPAPTQASVKPAPANPPPRLDPAPRPTDKPEAAAAGRAGGTALPDLLKDPVPRVTAILVAADRRLATVGDDGQIVGVGDTIGRRVVVGIDERTVLLREPSGMQIRVALGGRVVGVERPDR